MQTLNRTGAAPPAALARGARVGSILHGAYGDYYEQMLCLRRFHRLHPEVRLVLFFASEARLRELRVFDLSFATEVHLASELERVAVDRFLQYQIQDAELQEEVIRRLPERVRAQMDHRANLKPWSVLRPFCPGHPDADLGLSEYGRGKLPWCFRENGLDPELFEREFTVGFLWRYRAPGGAVSATLQTPEETVLKSKSALLSELAGQYNARILICGMNVTVTEANRTIVDGKYTDRTLSVDPARCTYLKGLSWGLELEILRRCSLCIVMPSGFSEALWWKRRGPTLLVDPPPHYLLKLLKYRMSLFAIRRPAHLLFQLRQPHTAPRVLRFLRRRGMLPATRR